MQYGTDVVVDSPQRISILSQYDRESPVKWRRLVQLLALGHMSLIVATWPLWIPTAAFPRVPLIEAAGHGGSSVESLCLALLLASLTGMIFGANPPVQRVAAVGLGVSTLALIVINQHRLQPWAWQFVLLSLILAAADGQTARRAWQWLVISIYFWSAWSKVDVAFSATHGYFMLAGYCKSLGLLSLCEGLPKPVVTTLPALIPLVEFLIAFGLAFRSTRRVALVGATVMHVGLILALGPLGHGHQPGVLIWNLFFLIQNGCLFAKARAELPDQNVVSSEPVAPSDPVARPVVLGNRLATVIVAAAMLWPAFEAFGYCDHWPAWAVYASHPERVTVLVPVDEIAKVRPALDQYLAPHWSNDEWYSIRIDRWSLDAVRAPIYPQDRFQVGVALAICEQFGLNRISVVIEGPANRWTGKRTVNQYPDRAAVEKLARSFRCNAIPHQGVSPQKMQEPN